MDVARLLDKIAPVRFPFSSIIIIAVISLLKLTLASESRFHILVAKSPLVVFRSNAPGLRLQMVIIRLGNYSDNRVALMNTSYYDVRIEQVF